MVQPLDPFCTAADNADYVAAASIRADQPLPRRARTVASELGLRRAQTGAHVVSPSDLLNRVRLKALG